MGQEIWLVRSRESLVIDIIAQVSPLVENSQVIKSCKMILWSIYQMSELFLELPLKQIWRFAADSCQFWALKKSIHFFNFDKCSFLYWCTDYDFAIKCGGPQITSSDQIVFERDNETLGPATYYVTDTNRSAVSNIGLFSGSNNPQYTSTSSSQFTNTLDSHSKDLCWIIKILWLRPWEWKL